MGQNLGGLSLSDGLGFMETCAVAGNRNNV